MLAWIFPHEILFKSLIIAPMTLPTEAHRKTCFEYTLQYVTHTPFCSSKYRVASKVCHRNQNSEYKVYVSKALFPKDY